MSVRIDHKMPRHPKVIRCCIGARWLFLEALCYCDEYGTGGRLCAEQWRHLPSYKARWLKELQQAGLVEEDLSIHDWEDLNATADHAKKARDRKRRQRFRERFHEEHGHYPVTATSRDQSRDGSRDPSRAVTGPTPTPTPTPSRSKDLPPKVPASDGVTERSEALMESLELNAATRSRIRGCGLPPERIYTILRDTLDARPKRPGGYAWKLVQRELAGEV